MPTEAVQGTSHPWCSLLHSAQPERVCEDAVEYIALFTGTHRFEVVFDDRLHVSGKNFRSNRRGNVTGDYDAESLASVRFCPWPLWRGA